MRMEMVKGCHRIYHNFLVRKPTSLSMLSLNTTKRFSSFTLTADTAIQRLRSLKIASYNVLADCYVRVPDQFWNAFAYCSDENLDWYQRCPKIVAELLNTRADVLCLQEVVFEQRDGLWALPAWTDALVDQGYTGIMQGLSQKEITKNSERNLKMVGKPTPTGLAVFYKRDLLKETLPAKHGSGSGSTVFLQPSSDAEIILAINTLHLVGDPSKFDMQTKQLQSAYKNFSVVEQHAAKTKGASVAVLEVICGDFNGDINMEDAEENSVSGWFRSNGFSRVPTGATWANDTSISRLDHFMYRTYSHSSTDVGTAFTVREYGPQSDERAEAALPYGLPNSTCPSDHLMIHATFDIISRVA
jgi:mRNA deadenylase 3'-5' endonuclease subunit Ccr4